MSILHQGNTPVAGCVAAAQRRDCGTATLPFPIDIARMLRADRARAAYFGAVASDLAAAWRENAR